MRIPMAALRRALSEMAGAGGVPHIERGMLTGMLPGAALGGVGGAAMDMANDDGDPETGGAGMGMGLIGGALGGMALGAGAGGFSRGLREALAARAAERGMGRAVSRVAGDVDDAARFHGPQMPAMRSLQGPGSIGSGMDRSRLELAMQRLQQERQMATHPDEIADLDAQIEELTRMLGGGV